MIKGALAALASSSQAPVVIGVWSAAVLCSAGAAMSARSAVEALKTAAAVEKVRVPQFRTVSEALPRQHYEALRERLARLHPSLEMRVDNGLIIVGKTLDDYTEWRLAVLDALQAGGQATWKPDYLCAGMRCKALDAAAFKIRLSGTSDRLQLVHGK